MRMSGFGQTLVDLLRRRYSHCLPDFKAASDLKSTLQRLLPAASGERTDQRRASNFAPTSPAKKRWTTSSLNSVQNFFVMPQEVCTTSVGQFLSGGHIALRALQMRNTTKSKISHISKLRQRRSVAGAKIDRRPTSQTTQSIDECGIHPRLDTGFVPPVFD